MSPQGATLAAPDFAPIWQSGPASSRGVDVAWGDVDGDGRLDAVFANGSTRGALFLNQGGILAPVGIPVGPPYYNDAMTLADLNLDGRLDLVTGGAIHLNQGGVLSEFSSFHSPVAIRVSAVGDVDGDGDLDLVAAGYQDDYLMVSGKYVFRNDGGVLVGPTWQVQSGEYTMELALGDMDNDGDLDLFCANYLDHYYEYYFNGILSTVRDFNGDGFDDVLVQWIRLSDNSPLTTLVLGGVPMDGATDLVFDSQGSWTEPAALDFNGDGFADLAIPTGFDEIRIYFGGSDPDTTADLVFHNVGYSVADAGDLNGDGNHDLALVGYGISGEIRIYFGGSSPDTVADFVLHSEYPGGAFSVGDVNGDGFGDLLVSHPFTSYAADIAELYFGGSPMDSSTDLVLLAGKFAEGGVSVSGGGDFNGDGFADFVVGSRLDAYSTFTFLYLGGAMPDTIHDLVIPYGVQIYAPAVSLAGDINGDSYADLVVGTPYDGNFQGRASVYYGGPTLDATPDLVINGNPLNIYGDFLGYNVFDDADVNGDGFSDIVVSVPVGFFGGPGWGEVEIFYGGASPDTLPDVRWEDLTGEPHGGGRNSLYRNDGGQFTQAPVWTSEDRHFSRSVALGDLDGDGYLEALVQDEYGTEYFSPSGLVMYRNEGGLPSPGPTWATPAGSVYSCLTLGDLDQDGDLDLVAGDASNSIGIFVNDGGLPTVPQISLDLGDYGPNALALGDVDDDGDLDLLAAAGNDTTGNGVNTLFRNDQHAWMSTSPIWSGQHPGVSLDVVFTDLDRDGDLDLVFANAPKTIAYYNDRGSIPTAPSWTSTVGLDGSTVDAADLDGDGYPEVVIGTQDYQPSGNVQPSVVLKNRSGVLDSYPVWTSQDGYSTSQILLSDINRDGWPDLILANNQRTRDCGSAGEPNGVYFGRSSGLFDTQATLLPGMAHSVWLALDDFDDDGAVDVAFSNSCAESSRVFLNDGQFFEASPSWTTTFSNSEVSVTAGDLDGDGLPDLIFPTRVFRNLGGNGSFSAMSWPGSQYGKVAKPGDVDGDGDLDLVVMTVFGPQLFMNSGNGLDPAPSWDPSGGWSRTFALGDVDLDGDLDMVCVNWWSENTIYEGLRNPAFRGDPLHPASQLPNNPPVLRSVGIVPTTDHSYEVKLTAYDAEGDPFRISGEYKLENDKAWSPISWVGDEWLDPCPDCLSASPEGVQHRLTWDVSSFPIRLERVQVRLHYVSVPRKVPAIQHTGYYGVQMDYLIRRPRLREPSQPLAFPVVTVGDSVTADLVLQNEGNAPMTVTGISVPASFRMTRSLPFTVPPGGSRDIPISFVPTVVVPAGDEITVVTDDPLNGSLDFPVALDVRDLYVDLQDLSPDPAPLGEAFSVFVTPESGVRVESGRLFFRLEQPSGTYTAGVHAVNLVRAGNGFLGTVPGEAMNELGVDYWTEVENSGITKTYPEGAPDVVFSKSVEAPTELSVSAQTNFGSGYLEGFAVNVLVLVKTGTVVDSGTLFFRRGGESSYRSVPIATGDILPQAAIPDTAMDHRGVDYWVEIHTAGGTTLTDPPVDPAGHPLTLQTTVLDLQEPESHPGGQYRMISFPLSFPPEFTGTFGALLAEQPEFGSYNPKVWRAFTYAPSRSGYVELSDPAYEGLFRPKPGRAFWLVSKQAHRVDTKPFSGLSTPTDAPYTVTLDPGWNQIGDPFAFPVAWEAALVDGVPSGEQSDVEPPWAYTADGYLANQTTLLPFDGYWIRNNSTAPATLRIPPLEALPEASASPRALAAGGDGGTGWSVRILAAAGDLRDATAEAGVVRGASESHDRWDRSHPPLSPEGGVSVYFPHDDDVLPGMYAVDMRPTEPEESGYTWSLDVAGHLETDREVVMTLDPDQVPAGFGALLIDRTLDRVTDLRTQRDYRFLLGTRTPVTDPPAARFELAVGPPDFIQSRREAVTVAFGDRLFPNYPNPFSTATVIRYEIPRPGPVRIQIFDVQGRLLRTLVDGVQEAGRYEAEWDGRDTSGVGTPPGIYFFRITSPGADRTRRMVRIR